MRLNNFLLYLVVLLICITPSTAVQSCCKKSNQTGNMSSYWDECNGTLTVYRDGQKVVVYERDTKFSTRDTENISIANAITQLYAVGQPEHNLVRNSSPIVPPQALIQIRKNEYINDTCSNECVNSTCYYNPLCDYFTHHAPNVMILKSGGQEVKFRVLADSTQHNNKRKQINYTSEMIIRVV